MVTARLGLALSSAYGLGTLFSGWGRVIQCSKGTVNGSLMSFGINWMQSVSKPGMLAGFVCLHFLNNLSTEFRVHLCISVNP